MRKIFWYFVIFAWLIWVSKVAGRTYAQVGGGFEGQLAALAVLGIGVMFYLVGAIILSHLYAFAMVGSEKFTDWRRRKRGERVL